MGKYPAVTIFNMRHTQILHLTVPKMEGLVFLIHFSDGEDKVMEYKKKSLYIQVKGIKSISVWETWYPQRSKTQAGNNVPVS